MFAYLDAGSGSMLISAVAAGAAGTAVAAKAAWQKISPGRRKKRDADEDASAEDAVSDNAEQSENAGAAETD